MSDDDNIFEFHPEPKYRPYRMEFFDGMVKVHSLGDGPRPNWWVRMWMFLLFKARVKWDDDY